MMGFAQGIDICYGSTKNDRNVVFFQDGTYRDYRIGGIIEEVLRDEVVSLITEDTREIMVSVPKEEFSSGKRIPAPIFQILEDFSVRKAPAAGALFRTSLYEAVLHTMIREKNGEAEGSFSIECYEYFLDRFMTFVGFVEALAANNSGEADEEVSRVAELFENWAEGFCDQSPGQCGELCEPGKVPVYTYRVIGWLQLLLLEYSRIRRQNKLIKFCANCGRVFVPQKRVDAIYCDQPSPQDPQRACNEIGAQIRRRNKRNGDGAEHEHHNRICRLHNMVRRARERGDGKDLIEHYKRKIDAEMIRYEAMKNLNNI